MSWDTSYRLQVLGPSPPQNSSSLKVFVAPGEQQSFVELCELLDTHSSTLVQQQWPGTHSGHIRSSEEKWRRKQHFSQLSFVSGSLTSSRLLSFSVSFNCLFSMSLFVCVPPKYWVSLIFCFLAASLSNCRKVITARDNTGSFKAIGKCCYMLCKQLQSY